MSSSSQKHTPEFDGTPARYERAADLAAVLRRLAEGGWTPLAGGTDFYPARVGRPVRESLLDLSGLHALRGIEAGVDDGAPAWRIGALTTWSDLARAPLDPSLAALQQVAREVGGIQIQNQATVGGNLCNASPAADGVPALLALDAQVELASVRGVRRLPVSSFVLGNRRTAIGPDELMTAVIVPRRSRRAVSRFLKLGHRRYLVISIVMAAVAVDFDEDARVSHCAVAVGACSSAALRLPAVERAMLSAHRTQLAERFATLDDEAAFAPLAPIDDVRGTATYRRDAAVELIRRIVAEVAEGAGAVR
ncbi:MAG TPA: FAD binding domain-containing protein [Burkholderiaceae bacterium]|nr:FAD binding domain-containing protein [Burkholderiaceae bacterium]